MKRSLRYPGRHEFFIEKAFFLVFPSSYLLTFFLFPSPSLPFSAGKKSLTSTLRSFMTSKEVWGFKAGIM